MSSYKMVVVLTMERMDLTSFVGQIKYGLEG
jgi:hypothetical protein